MADLSKIKLNGNTYNFKDAALRARYGVCSTAAATVDKTVSIPSVTSLYEGLYIFVKFANANSKANPTLQVNNLDAVAIKRYGTTAPSTSAASSWNAGSVVLLIYDGTYWQMEEWNNTTYSAMTTAEITAGTGTSARNITPANLKIAIETWAPVQSVNGNTGTVTVSQLQTTASVDNTEYNLIGTLTSNTNNGLVDIYQPTLISFSKYDSNFARLTLGSTTTPGAIRLYTSASGASGYVDLKSAASGTSARTITFPDATGTIALTSDIPSVSSWALASTKPSYTANEVGALPDDTVIPSKVSDLDNDSGFITDYTETDPIFVGSAAYDITANDITNWNGKSDFSGSYDDLTDKPTIPVVPTNISAFNNDSGYITNNMIEITWANLKTLRDSSQLVKGVWYRITDYNFITTKLGLQSGNHPFDIVLLAISESMLSESGYACRHAGDHYFEREVTEGGIEWLYTVYADDYAENYGNEAINHSDDIHSVDAFCDSDVRPHPNTGNDVPVLYKTDADEYSFDDPDYGDAYFYEGTYDLDGDEYDMWAKYEQDPDTGEWLFLQQYALTPIVVEDGELIVSPIPETKIVPVNMNAWELKYCLDNDKDLFDWAATDGKGVIYYLKDEFGNEAPYDFKNILFQRKNITQVSSNILSAFTQGESSRIGLSSNYAITCGNQDYYYYTFDNPYNAGNDSSLFGDSAYNVIKPYIIDGQRLLNNIVLGFANNNYFGNNCYDITIWGAVRNNNFEYECSDLLMYAAAEVDAKSLRYATMYSISTTKFDSGCRQCIGNMVSGFEVGAGSFQLNFGTSNLNNQIGRGCQNIKFGTYSYNNKFSHGVANCNLGNYVSYCEFGTAAVDITLPNYVRYCKFESDIHRVEFTTTGGNTSKYIQYVTVGRGISNLSVAPSRGLTYETIYYKTGRVETAV